MDRPPAGLPRAQPRRPLPHLRLPQRHRRSRPCGNDSTMPPTSKAPTPRSSMPSPGWRSTSPIPATNCSFWTAMPSPSAPSDHGSPRPCSRSRSPRCDAMRTSAITSLTPASVSPPANSGSPSTVIGGRVAPGSTRWAISPPTSAGNLLRQLEEHNIDWLPLLRSNTRNPDPLWFGVYGHRIYHHGAGFRDRDSRLTYHARDESRRQMPARRGGRSLEGWVIQVAHRPDLLLRVRPRHLQNGLSHRRVVGQTGAQSSRPGRGPARRGRPMPTSTGSTSSGS